jgi:PAS domain S-box-containing protein
METELRVLVVEDSEDDALLLLRELRKGDYSPIFERVDSAIAMEEALKRQDWEIVISDYVMPKFSGLGALRLLREFNSDLPFIIVSGNIGEDIAVDAMRAGAQDYIIKGNYKRLVPAVKRELQEAQQRSEKRQIEQALSISEERFRKRYEAIAAGVIVSNANGLVTHVNKAACNFLGISADRMIGAPAISKIWHATREDLTPFRDDEYPTSITLRTGLSVHGVIMGILDQSNRLKYWAQVDSESICDPQTGELKEVLTSFVDVSGRKGAEEELLKRNELLQLVMDNIPQCIFWKGLDYKYLGGNRNFLKQASVKDVEEIISRGSEDLLWNRVDTRGLASIEQKVIANDQPELHVTLDLGERAGEMIWADVSTVPMHDGEGRVVGVLGLFEDITERRKAEEELRERREQERRIHAEAEVAKREFYRKTISSVTDGRLNLVSYDEIEDIVVPGGTSFDLDRSSELTELRKCVSKNCIDIGLSEDQAYSVVVATGEAAANAVKHAKGGSAMVSINNGIVQILVKDSGQGMDALVLPRATLQKMFSTTMSMGLGYSLILTNVDRVYLATDTDGTWILMEKGTGNTAEQFDIDALPDGW